MPDLKTSNAEQHPDPSVTLADQAYERVKSILLDGQVAARGTSERQLALRTGFGLAPVRTALARLRAEGLIIVTPKSGITLPELRPSAILDFYEIRMALEEHVVGDLAARGVADRVGHIRALLQAQAACVAAGDAAAYHAEDERFHMALVALHGNEEIARVLSTLRDRMRRLSSMLHAGHPERMPRNHAQHVEILDAIVDGDGPAARERLRDHLIGARNHVMDPYSRLGRV